MAYTLQALIGKISDMAGKPPLGSVIVALPQEMALMPFTKNVRERFDIPFLPLTDEGNKEMPTGVHEYLKFLPAVRIAYIEAEFFGGVGTQAAALWENGKLIWGPLVEEMAINQVLRLLAVSIGNHHDEFDAIGLGRNRDTDDWKV